MISRSFEGHLRSFQGHLRSILSFIHHTISPRWVYNFLCLNSQKYSPSDVLSEYIYIFRVIFDILIDIRMTVHHSKKNHYFLYFHLKMATNASEWFIMTTRTCPWLCWFRIYILFSYLSWKLFEICEKPCSRYQFLILLNYGEIQ